MGRSWCVVAFLFGCGARSALDVPEPAQSDASTPDVATSRCDARDYTTDADATGNLVVIGGYVYFFHTSNTWSIARVATEGTTIEDLVHDDHLAPSDFVVDETWLYYATDTVSRLPNGGGDSQSVTSASKLNIVGITPHHLIVADDTSQLDALSKQDATLTPFFTQKKPTVPPVALVGVDDHIFWMTDEYVFDAVIDNLVPSDNDGWPTGLAMSGDDVYWTSVKNGTNRLVHRTTTTADQNIVYTGELGGPLGANASYVYGVTSGGIVRVSVATGDATLIAPYVFPKRLVIDGACIYALEKNGRLRRLPG